MSDKDGSFRNRHDSSRLTWKRKRIASECPSHLHFYAKNTWRLGANMANGWPSTSRSRGGRCESMPGVNIASSTCSLGDNDMQIWKVVFLFASRPTINMIINNVMFIHIKLHFYTQHFFFVWPAIGCLWFHRKEHAIKSFCSLHYLSSREGL